MIVYERSDDAIKVKWNKSPLGLILKQGRQWIYYPRAVNMQIKYEFASLAEAKQFIEGESQIVLNVP